MQTPVAAVARLWRLTLERAGSRLLLVVFGFHAIAARTVSRTQVRVAPSKSNPAGDIRSGDIVVANRASYIDILYFSATLAPVFTATTAAGGLAPVSMASALLAALSPTPLAAGAGGVAASADAAAATAEVVRSALRARSGPLLLFPEGVPTNGRAILTFTPLLEQVAAAVVAVARGEGRDASLRVPTTHIVALKYDTAAAAVVAPHTAGNGWAHAALLAGTPSNGLTVTRLPPGLEPQPADFAAPPPPAAAGPAGAAPSAAPPATAADPDAPPATWSAATRDALVQLVRGATAVALGASEYASYRRLHARQTGAGAAAAAHRD